MTDGHVTHEGNNNYILHHKDGEKVSVYFDRGAGWASYNQHAEESDDRTGFKGAKATHPKVQKFIDDGVSAIKDHQVKMHGSVVGAPLKTIEQKKLN